MEDNWIAESLLEIDGTVRVERGPQVVTLACTDENLSDSVTDARYKPGGRDAQGRIILADEELANRKAAIEAAPEGELRREAIKAYNVLHREIRRGHDTGYPPIARDAEMQVVDRRARHRPYVWKVYQFQETGELDAVTGAPRCRWIKVDEIEGRDAAIAAARKLAKKESA